MAKQIITTVLDDLDGSSGASTHTLSLDGHSVEIDLSEENFEALEGFLVVFLSAGRKIGSARGARATKATKAASSTSNRYNGHSVETLRTWARANGHEVADRGRISAKVIEAFCAANPPA